MYYMLLIYQYMLLIYNGSDSGQPGPRNSVHSCRVTARSPRKFAARTSWWRATSLEPASTATTVRARDGKPAAGDGPFAKTKEQLGGYYILDCKDLDEAIEFAAKIPTAQYGSIKIRPVMVFD